MRRLSQTLGRDSGFLGLNGACHGIWVYTVPKHTAQWGLEKQCVVNDFVAISFTSSFYVASVQFS